MSYYGQLVIREIERLEAHVARTWWEDYADRLTPDERRKLTAPSGVATRKSGHGVKLRRPHQPGLRPGWIEVLPNLDAHIASVKPFQGRWIITIDRMRDFRAPHTESVRGRSTKHSLDGVTTLTPFAKTEGDPEGVPSDYQNVLQMHAKERWAGHVNTERAEKQARDDVRRLAARLRDLAIQTTRAGGDPTAVLARFEREIMAAEQDELAA